MISTTMPPQFGAVSLKSIHNANHNSGSYDITLAVSGKDRRHFNALLKGDPAQAAPGPGEIRLYTVHSYGASVNGNYLYGAKSNKIYRLAQELLKKAPIPHKLKCAMQHQMKGQKIQTDLLEAYDKSQGRVG